MNNNRYSHKKGLRKTSKLNNREKRYCSCLMKVRANLSRKNTRGPYGICTSSVYNKQNKKRTKLIKCSKNYNFKVYSLKHLKEYAREKKIKLTKNKKPKTKSQLLKDIQIYTSKIN